ncbi:uncharacterized protein HMPREF1541_10388 [Cyphellophora europaea CBS 101466]|uniref:Uncharacterized protein n=1 Tax=Cyphellophora europaea (strain CBS 101466) TaxID=1220924 RepID=W2S9K3_CYPE1|nr:uncharacterized protein HMPREF1541_10388 [Cyphellophora europaea CBS 101466]ETN44718.1 hypothetical protein HMPREF1541_10388 [Cyphellophora europaea CBS 101466]
MPPPFEFRTPPARALLGGDLVAQSLSHLGVTLAFGLHGGHLDAFLVGCAFCTPPIRLIDTRHETCAVQAAEAYAKLAPSNSTGSGSNDPAASDNTTPTVGVAFVTANSGFSNALPGLATACADRSPVFVVTSSPPLREAETNALQGFHDQVVLAKPMTKFAHRCTNVEEIPRIVSYAFRAAQQGIPGPVVVDFPIDVLFSPPRSQAALSFGALGCEAARPPGPEGAALKRLAGLWAVAKRPVVVVGTGAARLTSPGKRESGLLALAQEMKTPVYYSSKFAPALPRDNPWRGGPATKLAALPYLGKERPDFVLLLGARTGFLLGGRNYAIIPEEATIVQVDLDGAEIGRSLPVQLGLVSDAGVFVEAFLRHVKESKVEVPARDEWATTVKELKGLGSKYDKEDSKAKDGLLHPYHALKAVFESIPPDSIVLIDGGEAGVWAMDLLEHARAAHALVSTGYLGFLGNGWGYSLGAALAYPDRLVVNIHGDGSAGFHIQELDTYARHGCRVLTVVMNNYFWGMSVAGQDLIYEKSESVRPASELSPNCRFDIVAQGFGCDGRIVERFEDVAKTTKELVEGNRASLLNLIVSRQPVTDTTKSMVGQTDDEDVIVVPYYDNVPKPFYREKGSKAAEQTRQNGTT